MKCKYGCLTIDEVQDDDDNNNKIAFHSQASWGRLDLKLNKNHKSEPQIRVRAHE
uniref:Uncharacterized protein n=1 Tax=Setaria italica TaxID=4555 RepID=K3ZBS2_SETIT